MHLCFAWNDTFLHDMVVTLRSIESTELVASSPHRSLWITDSQMRGGQRRPPRWASIADADQDLALGWKNELREHSNTLTAREIMMLTSTLQPFWCPTRPTGNVVYDSYVTLDVFLQQRHSKMELGHRVAGRSSGNGGITCVCAVFCFFRRTTWENAHRLRNTSFAHEPIARTVYCCSDTTPAGPWLAPGWWLWHMTLYTTVLLCLKAFDNGNGQLLWVKWTKSLHFSWDRTFSVGVHHNHWLFNTSSRTTLSFFRHLPGNDARRYKAVGLPWIAPRQLCKYMFGVLHGPRCADWISLKFIIYNNIAFAHLCGPRESSFWWAHAHTNDLRTAGYTWKNGCGGCTFGSAPVSYRTAVKC